MFLVSVFFLCIRVANFVCFIIILEMRIWKLPLIVPIAALKLELWAFEQKDWWMDTQTDIFITRPPIRSNNHCNTFVSCSDRLPWNCKNCIHALSNVMELTQALSNHNRTETFGSLKQPKTDRHILGLIRVADK